MMEQLISPKTLARVKDMPLIAKMVADGFLHGLQTSVQRGTGIEFSQYRSYEPSDPLNRIDWKLFARSDRYFIREAERESETTLWLVIDTSASMNLASADQSGWSKAQYAKHLAATLAYLGQKQGDNVGLLALSSEQLCFLPPGIGPQQWQRLLAHLHGIKSGACFPSADLLGQYTSGLQRPGLVVLISDFYQQHHEISDFISQVSQQHNEVAAIGLQTQDELNFNYQGSLRIKDLESGQQLVINAKQAKTRYFENLERHQRQLQQQLSACGVELSQFNIDQPMDEVLFQYLKHRQRMRA